ncbi:MAG: response regulator [Myxococcaceae bacterium]|jgi:CheY-like chemotaxis protein|nr:response regulator [Myxococcaceae bacterium]
MSKTVLIVEKDVTLMHAMRDALVGRGFSVEETTDGKSVPDVVKRSKPDCVVLAVDLDAGQNGYILCKKLKSDDDLKGVPVLIIGDPKGFGQHQKLKTRAEDYLGKPFEASAVIDRVGALAGYPPEPEAAADEGFDPGSLLDEGASPSEELAVESATSEETVGNSDPDFEMVDAMFDDKPADDAPPPPPVDEGAEEISLSTSNFDEDEFPAEKTVVGFLPTAPKAEPLKTEPLKTEPPKPPAKSPPVRKEPEKKVPFSSSPSMTGDGAEARELRAKVAELTGALEDANRRATEFEDRARELETQLEARQTELEAAKSGGGKSDKDLFALRDSVNKKDKEILRLKNELNEKEKEIVELREKENSLDQQVSESSGEMARKDAQLKTLQAKADQLTSERKKIDQQLLQSKEEARSAQARLTSLQTDFDALQPRAQELEQELEQLRAEKSETESARQQAESDLAEACGEIDALKAQLEERSKEADDVRSQLEQSQIDLDGARNQVTTQAQAFADEISGLRQRIADLETESSKHEERANRQAARLKAVLQDEERVREALETALSQLKHEGGDAEDIDLDELAEA